MVSREPSAGPLNTGVCPSRTVSSCLSAEAEESVLSGSEQDWSLQTRNVCAPQTCYSAAITATTTAFRIDKSHCMCSMNGFAFSSACALHTEANMPSFTYSLRQGVKSTVCALLLIWKKKTVFCVDTQWCCWEIMHTRFWFWDYTRFIVVSIQSKRLFLTIQM